MKKIVTLSLAVFAAFSAFSQNKPVRGNTPDPMAIIHNNMQHKPFLMNLLHKQFPASAEKATGLKERVIALGEYNPSPYALVDTCIWRYTGTRGSQYDFNNQSYDFPGSPFDGQGPMFNYPGHSNTPTVLADSSILWVRDSLTTPLYWYEKTYGSYDANNNLIDYSDLFTDTTSDVRYSSAYNSSNTVKNSTRFSYNGTSWDSAYKRYFTYNSSNQITNDSIYVHNGTGWDLVAKYIYTYDSKGNVTNATSYNWNAASSTWLTLFDYKMTYNTNNQVVTFTVDTGLALTPMTKDSFAYTKGVNYYTYSEEDDWGGTAAGWQFSQSLTQNVNAKGVPDTLMGAINYGGSIINAMAAIIYDSYNNPDTLYEFYSFGGSSFTPAQIAYYYYETYSPTAVPNTVAKVNNVTLYPNPTNDQLYIGLTGTTPKSLFIRLVNSAGQLVRTENIPCHSNTMNISVADLTPGVYFISIQDQAGNMLHTQSIIKR